MAIGITALFTPRSDLGRFVQGKVTPGVIATVEAACKLVQDSARIYVPVRTGRLRDSITIEIENDDVKCTGRVAPHTDYAEFIEFGTGRMVGRPYMRPAYDETREPIQELFRSQLRTSLKF